MGPYNKLINHNKRVTVEFSSYMRKVRNSVHREGIIIACFPITAMTHKEVSESRRVAQHEGADDDAGDEDGLALAQLQGLHHSHVGALKGELR